MALLPAVKSRPQKLIDVFTDAEAEALANLPLVDGALMLLLLETGIRKGEARALQAQRLDLDLDRERLIVIGGKGGKDRTVPLTRRLTTTLAELLTFEGSTKTSTSGTQSREAVRSTGRGRSATGAFTAGGLGA